MAPSSFSLLLRHLSHHHHHIRHRHRAFLSPLVKHFSLSSQSDPNPSPKPSSLSARLSFVFDKIDEIERERAEKDGALQRIRAWRESKKSKQSDDAGNSSVENEKLGLGFSSAGSTGADEARNSVGNEVEGEQRVKKVGLMTKEIELAHPWPEWIELMERLVQQNYFDHRRKDEDKMLEILGSIELSRVTEEEGFDFTRDWKTVQTAILNFGRDRFDIFRSLSRRDVQVLVGYGCPSADKKVVFSSKLLRKHAHLDEGDVCSSCSLRNSCERAYLITNKEDEARTIDVMRVLLTYGFDPINGSVENKSLLKQKSVKNVVRKLLHEVVRLSAVPIDPNLPPPVIKPRPPKVKQPPPPPKKRVGRDDVEMKKGDWLCPKCNFMNFAKNVVCLQCDAKRPKRQLLPGEWECPQCNFLNYRRNMTCFNCEHKRPPDEYIENQMQGRQQRPITRLEKMANRAELSNAWNFDFDDDESDGADVAAFEYADPNAMHEDSRLDSKPQNANFGRPQDDLYRVSRASRSHENEYQRPAQMKSSMGFDDFDDEDDDIDSYELDNQNRNQRQESSSVRFSDVEGSSDSEGDDDLPRYGGASSRPLHKKDALSNSRNNDMDFDSDEDLPVHPKWKSSHVADSGHRGRGSRGPSRRTSFDSDEDDRLVFGSDGDDLEDIFASRQSRGNSQDSGQRGFRRGSDYDSNQKRRQNRSSSRDDLNFVQRGDFGDEFGGSSRGPRDRGKNSFNNRGGPRMNGRQRGGMQNFKEPRQRGSRNGDYRRSNQSNNWSDMDDDRPRRQRINVR